MTISRDEKIAARLAKLGGCALSSEEYHRGDDLDIAPSELMPEPSRKNRRPPIVDESGGVNMENLLCELLHACGVEVPQGGDDAGDFKHALARACLLKIQELAGKGPARGKSGGKNLNPNPLVAQVQAGASGETGGGIEPMYMSLGAMEQQTREMKERLAADPTPVPLTPSRERDAIAALSKYFNGR